MPIAIRNDYQYVFWVKADKREELVTDFAAIAGLLRLPEKDAQDQIVVVQAAKRWLEGYKGWLLILDNANDLQMATDFLSVGSNGHILLTTRAQAMGNLAQSVEIEKMEPGEGWVTIPQGDREGSLLANEAKNAADVVLVVQGSIDRFFVKPHEKGIVA